ncbi:hypothetical protein D9M72_543760 [compost metagenome]
MERTHQVLAFGSVDAGLAADGGIHHAEQAGGHVDDFDAAQPGGRHEAREVRDSTAAYCHHGVGAGEVVLSQDLPAERGYLDVLAFFGVRDFCGQRSEPGRGQLIADGVTGEPEGPRVDDQDPFDALPQELWKAFKQAAAHNDVVVVSGGLAGDRDDG